MSVTCLTVRSLFSSTPRVAVNSADISSKHIAIFLIPNRFLLLSSVCHFSFSQFNLDQIDIPTHPWFIIYYAFARNVLLTVWFSGQWIINWELLTLEKSVFRWSMIKLILNELIWLKLILKLNDLYLNIFITKSSYE